jgi:hypothetical protein
VTSVPVLRAPLIVVVLFFIGCLGIIKLVQRVARLPLVGRSPGIHTVYRRVADSTRLSGGRSSQISCSWAAGLRAPSAALFC